MSEIAVPAPATAAEEVYVAETELKAGALGFWGGMIQAVTHIAPGLNILLGLTFIVSFAGVNAPIAYIIGGLICLGVAIVLTQLAKQFTGAGGYFLYVSRSFESLGQKTGSRTGWITTWLYFLYDPVAVSSVCAFTGLLVQDTLQAHYPDSWISHISWYGWFFIFLAIVTVFTLFGVTLSIKMMLVLMIVEVGTFLALGLSGLVDPGPGGFNGSSFNPSHLQNFNALYLGVVFTILALSGFEAVAPLAEETENPRRNLPLAIVGSTVLVATFYAFVNWGVLVGHGTTDVVKGNFTNSDQVYDLAERMWGNAWLLVLFATVNSALAVAIAIQNASTRVFFSMGRIGALPRWLSYVHPRWKTPWNAILGLTVVTIILAMWLGSWIGPVNEFGMIGIVQTIGLIIVYSMGNIGALIFYGRERRQEFNWFLHGVLPIATSAALIWVLWKTVEGLHPIALNNAFDYAPWIALAWFVIGLVILAYFAMSGKEKWLSKAGEAAHERLETAEERAHRPAL
jgi:amino acid transporter